MENRTLRINGYDKDEINVQENDDIFREYHTKENVGVLEFSTGDVIRVWFEDDSWHFHQEVVSGKCTVTSLMTPSEDDEGSGMSIDIFEISGPIEREDFDPVKSVVFHSEWPVSPEAKLELIMEKFQDVESSNDLDEDFLNVMYDWFIRNHISN